MSFYYMSTDGVIRLRYLKDKYYNAIRHKLIAKYSTNLGVVYRFNKGNGYAEALIDLDLLNKKLERIKFLQSEIVK